MAPNHTATPEASDRVDDAPASTSAPSQRPYGLNRWTLLGRMTATPELRYTPSGTPVLNVGMATSSGGKTHFHDVVAWARSAEILAEFGRKGREMYLEGRLQPKVRDVDGQRVKQVDLVVESFQLIGSKTEPPASAEA
jgi:single-strand DNA-binding protein